MFGLGFGEIAIILVVALIVLGPSKLPEFAKGIGKGLREFRKATEDFKSTIDGELYKAEPPRPVNRPQVATPAVTPVAVGATDAVAVAATTGAVAVPATMDAVAVPATTDAVAVPTMDPNRRALAERSPLASPGVQPLASSAELSAQAQTSAELSAPVERASPATVEAASSGDKSSA